MDILKKLIALRQSLHQHPEISGEEVNTAERIIDFLKPFNPDKIIQEIGGYGVLAEFNGLEKGPTVLFRCELDALPILERNNSISYTSLYAGKAHLCGHDGHMTIVAGLAYLLDKERPKKGRVLLLFQPSEEDGQGALRVIQDKKFKAFKPDFVFALHNLPGYEMNKVILSENNFASASRGMQVKLIGKSSHAAEPENGINPAIGMTNLIIQMNKLSNYKSLFKDFALITPIHARLGNIAYGTSPGEAEIHFTLRSYLNEDMDLILQKAEHIVNDISSNENLKSIISYKEMFPATKNLIECTGVINQSRKSLGLDAEFLKQPFKWSEDFGYFTREFKGALFGLGAGANQPALHNPDFDFPDDLIATGMKLFETIYKRILNN